MPICKKCSNPFPNKVIIDGKQRVLNRRKYCLDCSPFGKHNTAQIHINPDSICKECGREYEYDRSKGHKREICNSCYTNRRRFLLKEKCVGYKGNTCQECGYDKCIQNLVFHHLDPEKKDFQIGGNHSLSWKKIKAELDKCVLLCNRCHGEVHAGLLILAGHA